VARSHRAPKFLEPPSSIAHILPLCSGWRPDSKSGSMICLGRGGWAIITAVLQCQQGKLCGAGLRRAASDGPVRELMDTAFTGPCCSRLGNAYQRLFACYRKKCIEPFFCRFVKENYVGVVALWVNLGVHFDGR
jgi:hypothetical protein